MLGKFATYPGNDEIGDCLDCTPGMYAHEEGLALCIDCPAGQFLELSMSDSVEDCVDCDVGKYVGSTGSDHVSYCSKCPPGMYGDQTGLVVCEECGVGGYMPEEGALGRQATANKLAHLQLDL